MRATGQALLSHWRRHPGQLLLLVLGLAMATALWSAVQAINGEARRSYDQAAQQLGAAQIDILVPRTGGSIALSRYVALRRAGWQLAPVLEGRWRLPDRSVTLQGIDLLSHPPIPALAQLANSDEMDPLALLQPPGRLIAAPGLARYLRTLPDLPPVLEAPDLPPDRVITDIALAEELLNRSGTLSRLLVLPEQSPELTPLSTLAPELIRQAPSEKTSAQRLTDSFHLNLTAFGLLSFAVGLFIVHGMIGLAFEQRRGLFRTLRAMGVSLRGLIALLLFELILLALLAGGLGLILGFFLAGALLPDVAATLRGLYGAPVEGGLTLRPLWILSGLGMALAGTFMAGSQALWRVARLPLLSAPGVQSWSARARSGHRWQALAGGGLAVVGVLSVLLFDGLLAGFALLAGIMLGTALALPVVLSLLLSLLQRSARGPLAEWVWSDMRAQLPGLSLALMALLLAIAANIGVGTMVSSFRLTFLGWMDQRLSAELYVTARNDAEGAALQAWFRQEGIRALPIRSLDTRYDGTPLRVYGVIDDATYRGNWPILEATTDSWDRIAEGRAILINEQLARRFDLWTGDVLTLQADWELPIVGVYSDYGNPNGQAIVSLPDLLERAPDIPHRQFGLRLPPQDVAALQSRLQDSFGLPASAMIDQVSLKRESLAIFDKTFVVTGALNILTLGVAGFAILTSLLTLWTQRQPQLAPVWALGVTRAQLARLEILRSVLLAVLTWAIALPLGLALAWVLLSVINVEAFGWKLPLFLFPLDWLRLAVLAILAAALAALIPARRLRRLPPADLLKVFAHER